MKYPPIGTKDFAEMLAFQLSAITEDIIAQHGKEAFFENVAICAYMKVEDPEHEDSCASLHISKNRNSINMMGAMLSEMSQRSDATNKSLYLVTQCQRIMNIANQSKSDEIVFDRSEKHDSPTPL